MPATCQAQCARHRMQPVCMSGGGTPKGTAWSWLLSPQENGVSVPGSDSLREAQDLGFFGV